MPQSEIEAELDMPPPAHDAGRAALQDAFDAADNEVRRFLRQRGERKAAAIAQIDASSADKLAELCAYRTNAANALADAGSAS